jgi:hypothetical protein
MIIDKLAGELSPGQAKKLEKHLASCETCRQEAEMLGDAWQVSDETLKADSFATELTPQRRSEILAAAEYEEKRKHSSRMIYRLAEYFAIVLVCFVFGIMLLPEFNKSGEKTKALPEQNIARQASMKKMNVPMRDEETLKKGLSIAAPVLKESREKAGHLTFAPAPAEVNKPAAIKEQQIDKKRIERAKYANTICSDELKKDVKVEKELAPASAPARSVPVREVNKIRALKSPPAPEAFARKRKAVKSELQELCCEAPALPEKTFKLNLECWKLTSLKNVIKYFKDNKCPIPDNIKINKTKNTITIQASNATLEKIEKLFKKLQEKEKKK